MVTQPEILFLTWQEVVDLVIAINRRLGHKAYSVVGTYRHGTGWLYYPRKRHRVGLTVVRSENKLALDYRHPRTVD